MRALANEKIHFHWNTEVLGLDGTRETGVTAIRTRNNKTGEEISHPWTGYFVAIGHIPNSQVWEGLLPMDETGYILGEPDSSKPKKTKTTETKTTAKTIDEYETVTEWEAVPLGYYWNVKGRPKWKYVVVERCKCHRPQVTLATPLPRAFSWIRLK